MNRTPGFPAGLSVRICTALFAVLAGHGSVALAVQQDASEPRAEIQINLCARPQDVIHGLALQPDDAGPTEVWYFDTPGLEYARRGLVFRLRRGDRKPELTLKVTNQDCTQIKAAWIPKGEGKCEYDNHGALFSGTVSLMHTLDDKAAQALMAGRLPLKKALGEAQIAYLRDVVSAWPLVSAIRPLGPIKIQQYRAKNAHFDVNVWQLPAGETTIELSEKTTFKDVLHRRSDLLALLSRTGIALCPDQAGQGIDRLKILLKRP
jgi:hypothetical protein